MTCLTYIHHIIEYSYSVPFTFYSTCFQFYFHSFFSFQPILLPVSSDSSDGTTSDGSSMAEYQRISRNGEVK